MDRNSKAKSTRLSGIFDLFSEDKTGRDDESASQENSQEKSPKETKEKKVNLFSFRKKCESESKVHEKRKNKPIIRYFSSDHSSKETKSVKGRGESIDYEGTQVILRKPRLARDLMQNQNSLRDQGERSGQGRLDLSFPTEQEERPQSSPCEIWPTASKGLATSTRPKLFRFSSKQKEKLTEPSGIGMLHSAGSFHHQIAREKEVKANVKGEVLQSPSNSEDVLIISHGKSVKRFRSEGRCEELDPVDKPVIVNSEISPDFVITKEENCYEAVSRNKMVPLCSKTEQDDEDDGSKNATDVSENSLKKYFGFLVILVRNSFIFLKSSVLFLINFVLFLPRNLLLAIKSLFLLAISSCNRLSLGIKTRLSRIDQRELNEDSELQKSIEADYANEINHDENNEMVATVSPYERWQGNLLECHVKESDLDSKSCKSKWRRLLRQLSKDERQKLNRANSASDFDEPEESKTCITESEIIQNQGNRLLLESYGKQEDAVDLATVEVKQERSLIRSFFLFTRKAFEFLLSVILFIPLNTIYVLKYFFSNIYYLVFRNPVKLRRNSTKNAIQPDSYIHHDSKINEIKKENDKNTKYERSLSVFRLIKKKGEGSRKERIKDDIDPSNTTAGFAYDSNSGGTSEFSSPFFDPKVPMKKVVSFFSVLFCYIGLCLVTLINVLVMIISNIFVFMKLLLLYAIRLICLPFVLLGKATIFLVKCIKYLIWLLGTTIFCSIKVFCLVLLLILSLPIGVIVLLKICLCFLVDILWNCCLMVVRRGSMTQLLRDDEENNTTAHDPESEIRGKARVKHGGKIEKILKRLHVNALFKKRKKSPERDAFSAEHSSLHCSVRKHASSESESIIPVLQENSQAHEYQSGPKQGTVVRKLFAFTVKPLLNILSIILALPLRILAVFRMTFYSLLSCMKISSWSHNNSHPILSSDQETSAETSLHSTDVTSGESNDANLFLNLEITNTKLRRSDSSGEHVSDSWEDERNLETGQSFMKRNLDSGQNSMNLTTNAKSVSENADEESERKKRPLDPRPYLMRTVPFFRIFFHLQSIFVAALWHRIDGVMSSVVKKVLLGILRLTPSVAIKWVTTVAVRFTPGIKNRKILLSFLEDTPATITKRALEAYVKRVSISVMMVHAQRTLKDSTSKTVVRCMSEILRCVTNTTELFFLNVSRFFKQVSKKMRIRKSKERSSLKERVLLRLKSEDGCHKKSHLE